MSEEDCVPMSFEGRLSTVFNTACRSIAKYVELITSAVVKRTFVLGCTMPMRILDTNSQEIENGKSLG